MMRKEIISFVAVGRKVFLSEWEGNGKEILSSSVGKKWERKIRFVGIGGKWEGHNESFWRWAEAQQDLIAS